MARNELPMTTNRFMIFGILKDSQVTPKGNIYVCLQSFSKLVFCWCLGPIATGLHDGTQSPNPQLRISLMYCETLQNTMTSKASMNGHANNLFCTGA